MTDARAFRGFRFPAEVILWAVRWYLQFPISYRDLERMLADRGVEVDHTTMYRWVRRFAPELEKRLRHLPTVCLAILSSCAIAVLLRPSPDRSTMRARKASACAVRRRLAHASNSPRSASLSTSAVGLR